MNDDFFVERIQMTPPSDNANADPVLCDCSGTTRSKIQSLFAQGLELEAISRRTGALSGCGGCEWDIAEFLKELAADRNK